MPVAGEGFQRKGLDYKSAEEHPSGITKIGIDDYAWKVAESLKLKPGGDLFKVIRDLGGRIHYQSPFSGVGDEDTVFVHGEGDFDIVLSELMSSRRNRFTAAHELGHYVLHSKVGKIPLKAARRGTGRSEWEANWFAAGLLMPKPQFLEQWEKGQTLPLLADYFLVSLPAAEVRAKSLGKIKA